MCWVISTACCQGGKLSVEAAVLEGAEPEAEMGSDGAVGYVLERPVYRFASSIVPL